MDKYYSHPIPFFKWLRGIDMDVIPSNIILYLQKYEISLSNEMPVDNNTLMIEFKRVKVVNSDMYENSFFYCYERI